MVMLAVMAGCSTEKDAPLNVGYHNMTARYNGYFNAGEIINQSMESYRNSFKEDYSEILPLQVFPVEEDAASVFPDMDLAIEKCSKVIFRHSMPDPNIVSSKDEENCRWIDDNWFLIGKSHFIKREYDLAEEKFKYIKKEYENESSLYASEIWLAKIYILKKDYTAAKLELLKVKNQLDEYEEGKSSILDLIKKGDSGSKKSKYQRKRERREKKRNKKGSDELAKFSKRLKVDYEVTMADLFIKQEEYKMATDHLIKAIDLAKRGKEKARYQFVLGQLYQKMENKKEAEAYFQEVIESNAPYEMRFYAKINKTLSSTAGGVELREDLYKMLKDYKNEEYKDQIYYVLAELDLNDSDRKGAISNLTKSVMYSVNNDKQKAKSYLILADMHFEDRLYIKSQKYYDSCVSLMSEEHPNYEKIESKAKSLFSLVENYEVYTREDSLQKLVEIPKKEREKELKRILKEMKERERIRKVEEQNRLLAKQNRVSNAAVVNGSGSKWYFYNAKSRDRGTQAFLQEWGNRPLEDNWRRSNKQSLSDLAGGDTTATEIAIDSLTVDILREGLPLTDEALLKSKNDLINAVYNLGMIYKNQLSEEQEAISYFTMILDKKEEHDKKLPTAYQLYLIHLKERPAKAQKYKDYILTNYKDSDIANLLVDPEYFINKEKEERKELEEYKGILSDYNYKRYFDVIKACNKVIYEQPDNKYLKKYLLLKANAISKTGIGGVEAVSEPLEALYELSPDSEEGRMAKAYLDRLNGETKQQSNNTQPGFKYNETTKHYFAVFVPNDKESAMNDIKIKIANFNSSYFGPDDLKLTNTIMGNNYQVILIKTFNNANKAKIYSKAFKSSPAKSLLNNISGDYEGYVMSTANYSILSSSQDLDSYRSFYEENY